MECTYNSFQCTFLCDWSYIKKCLLLLLTLSKCNQDDCNEQINVAKVSQTASDLPPMQRSHWLWNPESKYWLGCHDVMCDYPEVLWGSRAV